MPAEATKLREGFITAREPELASPTPSSTAPLEPLPSQVKGAAPQPEPPLDETEQLRRDLAAAADTWPISVKLLYRPIRNNKGEEVNELTFREPRASEINRIGNPTRMLWDGEIVIEERKMTYIMAALCDILPPLLDQLDPRDWNSCAYRLRKFFLPDARAW